MPTAGECIYENFKLEYQVIILEYVRGKSLKIEAVCFNPFNEYDKEAVFKHSTTNLKIVDEKLKIAFSILDSVIGNLNFNKEKLHKLVIKNNQVFYISTL